MNLKGTVSFSQCLASGITKQVLSGQWGFVQDIFVGHWAARGVVRIGIEWTKSAKVCLYPIQVM